MSSNKLLFLTFIFTIIELIGCPFLKILKPNETTNVELKKARNYADSILSAIMHGYDRKKPSHTPVILYTYMVIDNLREFNEVDMTMKMQATFILNWRDLRLSWEPKDYGNLTKMAVSSYKIQRIWLPQITIKAIMPSKATIIQSMNTELLITSSGNVFSASKISTLTTCDSQLENYPFDNPNCSLYVLCGEQTGEKNTVIFGNMNFATSRNAFFNGNNVTQNKHFEVLNFTSQRYYVTTDGLKVQNTEEVIYAEPPGQEKSGKRITTLGTFLHYKLYFRRNVITYSSSVLIPLYIGTLLMLISTDADNIKMSLILMILTIFFQYLTMTRISFSLPPNYLITPFCMKYAAFIFIETIVLFSCRFVYGYLLQIYENDLKNLQKLCLVKRYFRYFLLLHLFYCTFLLLFF